MDVFLNLPTTQEAIQNHELPIGLEFEKYKQQVYRLTGLSTYLSCQTRILL